MFSVLATENDITFMTTILNTYGNTDFLFLFSKNKWDRLQNGLTEKGEENIVKVKFEIWKQIFKESNRACNSIRQSIVV